MTAIDGLYWEAHGQSQSLPLILSAGLGGSGQYWRSNIEALAVNYRVILYDHRGTGRSSRDLDGVVSVDSLADDLIALMDGLGIRRANFIGHAAGGVAALALALKAPERVNKLVVVNGWSRLDTHFARCFDIRLGILRDSGPRAYLRAQPLFLYPAAWISANLDALDDELETQLADFQGADNLGKRVAALRRFDIDARLGEIMRPVLAVAAEDDMLVPSDCSRRLARGLPNGELLLLPRGGHACNITEPAAFTEPVLRWLEAIQL
ncbi:pyrimidine utilization protein D [Sphingopyxis sp. KK2]|uniref:pyrimidine utilization protein D n=1 Tax=Sphingopyxis sp. KK2 TaxID=1855727 RepID=UPI00097E6E36|nr:pyrimidine utilization protein D [Sphingopyxis sp. KK2]